MENNVKKFLEFNGKSIYFLAVDGTYWIAVKPICEALGVDYIRQFKNLKEDKILAQLLSKQTMVADDERLREMVCLPEKYVYGWLFSINSESADLLEYKQKCYDVLFNYFHGSITQRQNLLVDKQKSQIKANELAKSLREQTQEFEDLEAEKLKIKAINKSLKAWDNDLLSGQKSLFE